MHLLPVPPYGTEPRAVWPEGIPLAHCRPDAFEDPPEDDDEDDVLPPVDPYDLTAEELEGYPR